MLLSNNKNSLVNELRQRVAAYFSANGPGVRRKAANMALFLLLFIFLTTVFYQIYPGNDPDFSVFHNVNWFNPYADPLYANPPWLFLLIPWVFLPLKLGAAVNRSVMLLIFMYQLKQWHKDKLSPLLLSYFILFTSPGFIYLFLFNNVDYIILAGLMLPDRDKLVVLMLKPQVAIAGYLVRFKNYTIGQWPKLLLPAVTILVSTFLIWGVWPLDMMSNAGGMAAAGWNISFFPWSIPFGAVFLIKAWKENDLLLAAVVTPLLFPYLNITSLAVTMALLLMRHDYKSAGWLYGASWYFTYLLFLI